MGRKMETIDAQGAREIMTDSAVSQVKLVRVGRKIQERSIQSPTDAFDFWKKVIARRPWFDLDRETSVVLLLNSKLQLKGWNLVSIGSESNCFLDSKGVFRCAVACSASRIIVMHHHPSGSCKPSKQDLAVTRLLVRNGKLLGVPIEDHLIVAGRELCSFREDYNEVFDAPSQLDLLAAEMVV